MPWQGTPAQRSRPQAQQRPPPPPSAGNRRETGLPGLGLTGVAAASPCLVTITVAQQTRRREDQCATRAPGMSSAGFKSPLVVSRSAAPCALHTPRPCPTSSSAAVVALPGLLPPGNGLQSVGTDRRRMGYPPRRGRAGWLAGWLAGQLVTAASQMPGMCPPPPAGMQSQRSNPCAAHHSTDQLFRGLPALHTYPQFLQACPHRRWSPPTGLKAPSCCGGPSAPQQGRLHVAAERGECPSTPASMGAADEAKDGHTRVRVRHLPSSRWARDRTRTSARSALRSWVSRASCAMHAKRSGWAGWGTGTAQLQEPRASPRAATFDRLPMHRNSPCVPGSHLQAL